MRLSRIKLDQVRQFRHPFEISGLEPGLNLFTGPNEAGKSTVVRAIRAAFFERHRSTSVDDLLPWGEPSATPTVELDFEVGDQKLSLKKSFLNKKRCELKVGGRQLDGEDAEQYLAELLGFEFSGRGASRPEHWGIPGLLWIEQGAGQEIVDSVGNAKDHLRKALDKSVGEVASSQGDDVIAKVKEQRDALLTSTGRPRAAYSESIAERDALQSKLGEFDQRIAQYQQQVDQLGGLLAEDASDRQTRPWEVLRGQESDAQGRLAAIDALREKLDADLSTLAQLKEKQKLIEDQLKSFDGQQRDLKKREEALADAQALVLTQQADSEALSAAHLEAGSLYQAACDALASSRQEDLRADLTRKVAQSESLVASISSVIEKAEAEQVQLNELQKIARETPLARADMNRLRDQQAKLNELRIRCDVAATRLQFDLLASANVLLGGQSLSGQGEQLVTKHTTLKIQGVGELQISPGGTDLAELTRESEKLLAEHQALLQRLGIATLVDAELRYALHQQALSDSKHAEKAFSNLAPDGLDTLRQDLEKQKALEAESRSHLDQLPAAPTQAPETLKVALSRQKAAGTNLEETSEEAAQAKLSLVAALTQSDGALRERDALLAVLASPERQTKQSEVNQSALNTRAERDALEARVVQQKGEVDAARPDILAQDVDRFKRSADQSERQFRERQTAITVIKSKLEEAGAQGLEESRAEMAVRFDAAQRRVGEMKLRADALDLLVNLLDAKRVALTKRLQAPLQKHIQHYLQLLFPQATLDIGEDLTPGVLTRVGRQGGESGHFSDMSFGAREQMGVISRLAYADLLKEADRPTLIIMDDALVHSDPQRLEQMQRVVFDASQRHQILIFTCHPANWRSVGASPVTISS
jgi:DNA repair exonuclease SbcCD ATPase subunit